MGLETVTHISDLVITNPVGAVDPKSQGDNHIRNIKVALKTDFPNITGVVSATQGELNELAGAAAGAGMVNDIAVLTDANADRVLFWDDSAGAVKQLAADGTSISISGTTLGTGSNVPLLNAANVFSQATANLQIIRSTTVSPAYLGLGTNSTTRGYFFAASSTDDVVTGAALGDIGLRAQSGAILFSTDGGTLNHKFTASNTTTTFNGVAVSNFATLSTSNNFAFAQNAETLLGVANSNGGASAGASIYAGNGTNTVRVEMQGTAASAVLSGGPANAAALLFTNSAVSLSLGTNFVEALRIDSSQNFNFKGGTVTTNNTSASEVGYKGVPQNSQSVDYTAVLADAGKSLHQIGASKTFTIPANASVAYPIGTALNFTVDNATGVSIAITTDTLRLAGTATIGTRTLAQYGSATALKIAATTWLISGAGLT